MRLVLLVFLSAGFLTPGARAQGFEKFIDTVYSDNLSSVVFSKTGIPLTLPIVDTKSGTTVTLSFDDMEADVKRYNYTVQLCNRDWTPSALEYNEYIDGFAEAKITAYQPGYNTLIPYEHYTLTLPNQDVRFTKSGNYLLKVYEDAREKKLALTRRFMLVEPTMGILPQLSPAAGANYNTRQEFNFAVSTKNFSVSNPLNEIRASVLQNGRWDNALVNLAPKYVQGDQILYDDKGLINFPAGKEFRFIDLRTYRSRTERMKKIERGPDTWEIYLIPDVDRSRQTYIKYKEINGRFIILSADEPDEPDLKGEYVRTHFALLQQDSIEDASVYVVGKLTDWQLKEDYKMNFHQAKQGGFYETTVLMKQGVYDYQYAVKRKNETSADFSALEGDWFEAENEYTIFIYYRPFGARYDRIVGVITFESNQL